MSFGGGPGTAVLSQAIDYAVSRNVVLVAAASNDAVTENGAPASELQPGNGYDINAGRGLVVTGAEFSDRNAATGRGGEVSLAAYGFYDGTPPLEGPIGLLSTYPGNSTPRESGIPLVSSPCGCRASVGGDSRYARLEGTSMAAPQVTALAAMIGQLNPSLRLVEKLRIIKGTARGAGPVGAAPGLRDHRRRAGRGRGAAGGPLARPSRACARARSARLRGKRRVRVRLRWRGKDLGPPRRADRRRACAPTTSTSSAAAAATAASSAAPGGRTLVVKLRRGRYRLYTRARDRSGNVEATPRRADVRIVVRR